MGNSEISMKSGGKRILFTGGSGKAGRQYVSISEPKFPLSDAWRGCSRL